jgi:hypothetical protein
VVVDISEAALGVLGGGSARGLFCHNDEFCFLPGSVTKVSAFLSTFHSRAFEIFESKGVRCVVLGDVSRDRAAHEAPLKKICCREEWGLVASLSLIQG